MTDPLDIAVIGATGTTGRMVVTEALSRGHRVRAIEPAFPDDDPLPPEVRRITADVLSDDLGDAFDGCDAVVSAVGLGLSAETVMSPPPIYTDGTRRVVAAMQDRGLRRLVVISASFVAARNRGPHWFRLASSAALGRVFDQMAAMEKILHETTDIDWTAVRPGWLLEGPATGDYTVTPNVIPPDMIRTRHADLAAFMIRCVETGDWIRATPAIARHEPAEVSQPGPNLKRMLHDG